MAAPSGSGTHRGDRDRAEAAFDLVRARLDVHDEAWPGVAKRIVLARESIDQTPTEIANLAGLGLAAYLDLEECNSEAFVVASIGELRRVASALRTSVRRLIFEGNTDERPTVSEEQLRDRLSALVADHGALAAERTGWDVELLIRAPDALGELVSCIQSPRNMGRRGKRQRGGTSAHRHVPGMLETRH